MLRGFHGGARRMALSLNTWFKHDAFGMTEYEIFARGSAAAIRFEREVAVQDDGDEDEVGLANQVFVLTCLHTVHPFRYPRYYSKENPATSWVHEVRPEEVKCNVRILDEQGQQIESCDLEQGFVVSHPVRDLALLRFQNSGLGRDFLTRNKVEIFTVDLNHGSKTRSSSEHDPLVDLSSVECHGHHGVQRMESDQDVSLEIPCVVPGAINFRVPESRMHGQDGELITVEQILAETDSVLTMGMCGGPVVHPESGRLFGLVEGILTTDTANDLGTHELASVVPTPVVHDLIALLSKSLKKCVHV